jgi:hypothetical protein
MKVVTAQIPAAKHKDAHYVYLYRDLKRSALYVGYGAHHRRASVHSTKSQNNELNKYLNNKKYTLEIAGPFHSEIAGRAVETALISALHPRFNIQPGSTEYRFRPLGLPNRFADRLILSALNRRDFFEKLGRAAAAVLLVYVGDQDFEDQRQGYNPANPPEDRQILERMNRWWQLGRYLKGWRKNPSQSPVVLIGLTGRPSNRFIIGAVKIDQEKWHSAIPNGGFYSIPTAGPSNLDACGLRGRRISPIAKLKFGALASQFFIILKRNGHVIGGG